MTDNNGIIDQKLTRLERAGLVQPSQIPLLKRALNKESPTLTIRERNALIDLLHKLIGEVENSQSAYNATLRQVRQDKLSGQLQKEDLSSPVITAVKGFVNNIGSPPLSTKPNWEPPPVVLLKRKGIRTFPTGKVVLYYADKLKRYVSIPYDDTGPTGFSEEITEETKKKLNNTNKKTIKEEETEDPHCNVTRMRRMVDNKTAGTLHWGEGSKKHQTMKCDLTTAHAIVAVHDKVNDANKTKVKRMANDSKGTFHKLAHFALTHT